MYAKHPAMAKRWSEHTPKGKKLPDHVADKKAANDLLVFWAKQGGLLGSGLKLFGPALAMGGAVAGGVYGSHMMNRAKMSAPKPVAAKPVAPKPMIKPPAPEPEPDYANSGITQTLEYHQPGY